MRASGFVSSTVEVLQGFLKGDDLTKPGAIPGFLQAFLVVAAVTHGGASDSILMTLRWTENGEPREHRQSVSLR